MTFLDANTWTGRWPFAFLANFSARTLSDHLHRHGIRRALVSPLDAVFAPEPGPANRDLLRSTRKLPQLSPVPVINPMLPNWRDELAACAADERVRAVRILPNYHNYRLRSRRVDELVAALTECNVRLVVNIRLIDERHEYFALNIKSVAAADLAQLLSRHPKFPVLASGLGRTDIRALTPKFPQLLADLSFAEWDETVTNLLQSAPAGQLAFASHTPFLITQAAIDKLSAARVSVSIRRQIAAENLEDFLSA
ncbi:MAG: hypothetical protein QM760_03325 [Nibricoccus sp.]